ncbi:MAG: hypothetical protein V4754_19765 [Pseudomonadota bacterium]
MMNRLFGGSSAKPARTTNTTINTTKVPTYTRPPAPPHLATYKKAATQPAETALVERYQEKRQEQSKTGQEKMNVGAEIKFLQLGKLPIERKLASLASQQKGYEDKIMACNLSLREAGCSKKIREMAQREKSLREQEHMTRTAHGYDQLLADDGKLEEAKAQHQSAKLIQEKNRATLKKNIVVLEERLAKASARKADLSLQTELQSQRGDCQQQLDTVARQLVPLDQDIDEIEQEKKPLLKRFQNLKDEIANYNNELAVRNGHKGRRREFKDMSSAGLREKRAEREQELTKVERSLSTLDDDFADSDRQRKPLLAQKRDLRARDSKLKTRLDNLAQEVGDADQAIDDAKGALGAQRKALDKCKQRLSALFENMEEVCEKLEQLNLRFEQLDNGPLKHVVAGLAEVQAAYKTQGISRKDQHSFRTLLELIEQHEVQIEKLEVAKAAQQQRLDALQRDEDGLLLQVDKVDMQMEQIQNVLLDLAANMKQQLEARAKTAAARQIGPAPSSGKQSARASGSQSARTATAEPDDWAVRNYFLRKIRPSGLEQIISGIDETRPDFVAELRNKPHLASLEYAFLDMDQKRSFYIYRPFQPTERTGTLPDGAFYLVPRNSPYYHSFELSRTPAYARPTYGGAAYQRHADANYVHASPGQPATEPWQAADGPFADTTPGYAAADEEPPPAAQYAQEFSAEPESSYTAEENSRSAKPPPAFPYPQREPASSGAYDPGARPKPGPRYASGGQASSARPEPARRSADTGKTQTGDRSSYSYSYSSSYRTATPGQSGRYTGHSSAGTSARPEASRRGAAGGYTPRNQWSAGIPRRPRGYYAGLEDIGWLNKEEIPPAILEDFAKSPGSLGAIFDAYPKFCAAAEYDGQPKNLYIIFRPALPHAHIITEHPMHIPVPSGQREYYVTEIPRSSTRPAQSDESEDDEPPQASREYARRSNRGAPPLYVETDSEDDGPPQATREHVRKENRRPRAAHADSDSDSEFDRPRPAGARDGPLPRAQTFQQERRYATPPPRPRRTNTFDPRHRGGGWDSHRERPWPPFGSGRAGDERPYDTEEGFPSGARAGARPSGRGGNAGEYASSGASGGGFRSRHANSGARFGRERPFGGAGQSRPSPAAEESDDYPRSPPSGGPSNGAEGAGKGTAPPSVEQQFLAKHVQPLAFTAPIDMSPSIEGRLKADGISSLTTNLNKGELNDDQRANLVNGLNFLINSVESDIDAIAGFGTVFDHYVAQQRRAVKKISKLEDMDPTQQNGLKDMYEDQEIEKIKEVATENEKAMLTRKNPGSSDAVIAARDKDLNQFMLDLSGYYDIEQNKVEPGAITPSYDQMGRKVRTATLSHARYAEMKKLIDTAKRDPRAKLSGARYREIDKNFIATLNSNADAAITGRKAELARDYLDLLYRNVFSHTLSEVVVKANGRINLMRLRTSLAAN